MSSHTITTAAQEWRLPSTRKTAVILVILTESALFTIFVVAYLYYIGKSLTPPYPRDVLHLPIIGSVVLLSSSATIVKAEQALKAADRQKFHFWWFLTALLGLGFLLDTGIEWHKLIYEEGLTISTNLFGSTFYSLVGLHASHVVVGLILILMLGIFSLRNKVQHRHHEHIEMISWYWHFVDGVWVVVFTVVYIIGGRS